MADLHVDYLPAPKETSVANCHMNKVVDEDENLEINSMICFLI